MKTHSKCRNSSWRRWNRAFFLLLLVAAFWPSSAQASIFKGETLDKVADVLTWVVLIVAPIVAITVFLIIHILPEKIAERRHHPQTKAIQCLCLLSLVFGGLLWPLAWLWAYTRPVFHRMAYGTDTVVEGEGAVTDPSPETSHEEVRRLQQRVIDLEARLKGNPPTEG